MTDKKSDWNYRPTMSVGVCVGLGAAIGVALDSLAIGVGIGAAIGAALSVMGPPAKDEDGRSEE